MKRAFTQREKVLLVLLVLTVIIIAYVKLIYEPVQDDIAELQAMTAIEQSEFDTYMMISMKIMKMQRVIDQIQESGEVINIPEYDNSVRMKQELYSIISKAKEYSLDFGTLVLDDYIARRPIAITFTVPSYIKAREIINDLQASRYFCQISDLQYDRKDSRDGLSLIYEVKLTVTYFEVMN